MALSLLLWCSPDPAAAGAGAVSGEAGGRPAIAVLDIERVALAAIAGAGVGAIAATVSGNAVTGAAFGTFTGTLAALYVAHLLVEAVVVGGVYYFWPWESPRKSGPPSGKAIRDMQPPPGNLGLQLATGR